VRKTPKERELVKMRAGDFLSPPQSKSSYTRNVRKTTSSFWKPWLKREYHCLAPVTPFCEPDWRTGKHVSPPPSMRSAKCLLWKLPSLLFRV
jgi:hypothetical protein